MSETKTVAIKNNIINTQDRISSIENDLNHLMGYIMDGELDFAKNALSEIHVSLSELTVEINSIDMLNGQNPDIVNGKVKLLFMRYYEVRKEFMRFVDKVYSMDNMASHVSETEHLNGGSSEKWETGIPQKSFGELLKANMRRKRISISKLAKRSLLSETTIKKYRNDIITPDIDNMMAIFIGMNLEKPYCVKMISSAGRFLKANDPKMNLYSKLISEHSDGNIDQWNKILHESGFLPIPDQRDKKKRENMSKGE